MNEFNSTELFEDGVGLEENGEQESVVDSPKSQYDGFGADGDGQEDGVDPQADSGNEEGSDQGENTPAHAGQGRARKQTREENSAARLARLRAERDTAARMTAETDERIARSGVMNPATGRPFKNMQEIEAYGAAQREAEVQRIARQTGRSADDVREEIENRDYIRKKRMEEEKAAQGKAFAEKDALDFVAKHPGVHVGKLISNHRFIEFCGSRLGKEPLASLYESFMKITGESESAGRAGAQSRSRRSTGSGGGGGEMLTPSQRASLDEWNRANPDMKMTAKEFLRR
ncbi:MAG: hypothetical protein IKC24_00075 [Oscillospiraceae bacterium]|nr:hypothetical protein [Oscillospiraceae bacterium]